MADNSVFEILKARAAARLVTDRRDVRERDFLRHASESDDVLLALVPLTLGETDDIEKAVAAAKEKMFAGVRKEVVEVLVDHGYLANRANAERVFRAARKPDDLSQRAFARVEDIMDNLDEDEVAALVRIQSTCHELPAYDVEELDELLTRLGNADAQFPAIDIALAGLPRTKLQDALIRASKRLAYRSLADGLSVAFQEPS